MGGARENNAEEEAREEKVLDGLGAGGGGGGRRLVAWLGGAVPGRSTSRCGLSPRPGGTRTPI